MKADESINKYKSGLMIKGFRQKEGSYCFNTYLLITRITFTPMKIAITSLRILEIGDMDVTITFLNGMKNFT